MVLWVFTVTTASSSSTVKLVQWATGISVGDTVGVGVTVDHKVFFTLNGTHLRPQPYPTTTTTITTTTKDTTRPVALAMLASAGTGPFLPLEPHPFCLYPLVTWMGSWKVVFNFGEKRFMYEQIY
jgi:hypothetical protein